MQTEPAESESELSAGDTSFRQNHPPHTTVLVHYAITQGLQNKTHLIQVNLKTMKNTFVSRVEQSAKKRSILRTI